MITLQSQRRILKDVLHTKYEHTRSSLEVAEHIYRLEIS
jgi:hypothetical protein